MTREIKIFLSYRRDDSADVTGRIKDRLAEYFGQPAILRDVDSIPLGVDFRTHIDRMVSECDVLLAVIGRDWLKMSDAEGKRRLDSPEDFVRIEIESALARNIPVVPLLVRQASMPPEDELPASLKELAYRNGIAVRRDPDFDPDMHRLIDGLTAHFSGQAAEPEGRTDGIFVGHKAQLDLPEAAPVAGPARTLGNGFGIHPMVLGAGLLLIAILAISGFSGWFGGGSDKIDTVDEPPSPTEPIGFAGGQAEFTNTPTTEAATAEPSATVTTTPEPVPSAVETSLPEETPLPLQQDEFQPAGLGTPMPEPLAVLSADNAGAVREIARWELERTVYGIAYSPGGDQLAIGLDGEIQLLDALSGSTVAPAMEAGGPVGYLFYLQEGAKLASAPLYFNEIDAAQLWNVTTAESIVIEQRGSQGITSFTASPDGRYCATGLQEWTIQIRTCTTAELLTDRPRHLMAAWVMSVAFSPDSKYLASGGGYGEGEFIKGDGAIRLWTVPSGGAAAAFYPMEASVLSLAFSPMDEALLVAGTDEGRVAVLALESGALTLVTDLDKGAGALVPVRDVAFSRDGDLLAAVDDDGFIYLWRTADWTLLNVIQGHKGRVWAIEFSPDGRQIATVSNDLKIRVWGALP